MKNIEEEQLVIFVLGNEEYGIPISQVKEIIHYKGTTALPETPNYMEVIFSVRGKIIPVVALGTQLALVTSTADLKQALIVETTGREVGIVVDDVTEVIRLQGDAIEPLPTAVDKRYIRGIGKKGNRLIILLDVDKLFDEVDMRELEKLG
jgi:purine-binding chemotaxis protein CheW